MNTNNDQFDTSIFQDRNSKKRNASQVSAYSVEPRSLSVESAAFDLSLHKYEESLHDITEGQGRSP